MSDVRFKMNRGAINDIATSNEVEAELRVYGDRILSTARSLAPVKSGNYQNSLHGLSERHRDRVAVHVVTNDPAGGVIESKFHVLQTALESA